MYITHKVFSFKNFIASLYMSMHYAWIIIIYKTTAIRPNCHKMSLILVSFYSFSFVDHFQLLCKIYFSSQVIIQASTWLWQATPTPPHYISFFFFWLFLSMKQNPFIKLLFFFLMILNYLKLFQSVHWSLLKIFGMMILGSFPKQPSNLFPWLMILIKFFSFSRMKYPLTKLFNQTLF